ncbi:pyridoxal-phosphate dependent enzyme [Alphaproteobacteria bacterium]|nr:pyridoxal-phosphate dependent enzyme [Alphaproteobacteria bacterium]
MGALDISTEIVNSGIYDGAVRHLRDANVRLPTFSQLANPAGIPAEIVSALAAVDPQDPHAANLFRVHWYNDADRTGRVDVPGFLLLPKELTGVDAQIAVAFGNRFPMIGSHKVLPAYACLVTRIVTGQFDPARHRAIWPSTGNYCRGGVAVSRILGSRGVAVLPEGMSAERFDWLQNWVGNSQDIIRTPGSESNVKEIYDKCNELEADSANVILNQFSEFANYLAHVGCTGPALEKIFLHLKKNNPNLALAAFVSGTGSAGTLGAGDYLKRKQAAKIVAVEPIECPTMLYNGYGAHNIQGIGDKHIPLIQNVMNSDVVAGVSDATCDALDVLFNCDVGREYLQKRRGLDPRLVAGLENLGLSGIANILAAIKTARYFGLTENHVIVTVATDGAVLYESEREKSVTRDFPNGFDAVSAGEIFGQHLAGLDNDHYLELSHRDRNRIFNLGYFTWVEQQGIELADFDSRRDQAFWRGLAETLPAWDRAIEDFNGKTGVA